jgi:hypothetical protein
VKWVKKGVIFTPDNDRDWMRTHASIPIGDMRADGTMRIYFGTRDGEGRSHIGHVDVDPSDPARILGLSEAPLLPLGQRGTFDDSGIMPSWLVNHDGRKFLYYIGWNPQVTVPYRLSIGLAISDDGGATFVKYPGGPVSDRSVEEPYFNTAPCVLVDSGVWRMWYVSCTGWELVNGWPEPRYHVKYAESADGINWRKTGHVCIDYDGPTAAIGRPCVLRDGDLYKMFYSYRDTESYRDDPARSYRLGYAESYDGLSWRRRDELVGIDRSDSGWDSQMLEYCSIYDHEGTRHMLYNGNGFGKSGFGLAVLAED